MSTYTLYPDASSVDGYVEVNTSPVDTAFSTLRGTAGTGSDATTAATRVVRIGSGTVSNYRALTRGIIGIVTSSISGAETVDSWVLSLWITAHVDQLTFSPTSQINIRTALSTPASNTALAASDFANVGTAAVASDLAWSGMTDAAYNDITGTNMSAINKSGNTNLGFSYAVDADNGSPAITFVSTSDTEVDIDYSETAGTTNDPKLVVVATVHAAGVNQPRRMLMGVG